MALHDLLVEVTHTFSLPGQTLPGPFGYREGVFQDVVAPLRPLGASGRIALRFVSKHRLHLYNTMESKMTLKRTEPVVVTETRVAPEELIVQFML